MWSYNGRHTTSNTRTCDHIYLHAATRTHIITRIHTCKQLTGQPANQVNIQSSVHACTHACTHASRHPSTHPYIHPSIHTIPQAPRRNGVDTHIDMTVMQACRPILTCRHAVMWACSHIVAIFYPFSQFCEINISLLSLQKQTKKPQIYFRRG